MALFSAMPVASVETVQAAHSALMSSTSPSRMTVALASMPTSSTRSYDD